MLVLALAASVAMGPADSPFIPPAWLDSLSPLASGPAAVLAAEEDAAMLRERLRALVDCIGSPSSGVEDPRAAVGSLIDRLSVYPMRGMLPEIVGWDQNTGYVPDPRWLDALAAVADGHRILFLDPLRRFHALDENNGAAMTRIIQTLEAVSIQTGCAVVVVHHVSKISMWQGHGTEQQAARGSSALTDAVRWQVNIHTMTDDEAKTLGIPVADRRLYMHAELAKCNYSAPLPDAWFRRVPGGILIPCPIGGGMAAHDKKPAVSAGRRVL